MMLLLGILIIPVIILIIFRLKSIKVKKLERFLLNLLLIFIAFIYIYLCIKLGQEPYQFDFVLNSIDDYLIATAIIFITSPLLWIITLYYTLNLTRKLRIKKNSIIKQGEFTYYRDDLNKISPNIIMFTALYDIDFKKSISSTILKLKLMGFIEEKNKKLICTDKNQNELSESEKLVLNLVKNNEFDKILYKKVIEKETLKGKYIKKNKFGKIGRILFVFFIIVTLIFSFKYSIKLDKFTFNNYRYYTSEKTGIRYIKLGLRDDVLKAIDESASDDDFLIVKEFGRKKVDYNYVKADRYDISVVKKAQFLTTFVPITILFCVVYFLISIYMIIEQLINFNKHYRRTIKGKELLTKAYALKNFLEDFSTKNKKEKELILWEYYLIYATLLGVNVKIQDEIIEKYIK